MRFEYTGLFGLIILIADLWAIISTIGSDRSTGAKVVWTLLIIFLPIVGWLIWLIAGPRSKRA